MEVYKSFRISLTIAIKLGGDYSSGGRTNTL